MGLFDLFRRDTEHVWYLNGERQYSDYDSPEWRALERSVKRAGGVYPRDPEQRALYNEYEQAMEERDRRGGLLGWIFGK